MRKMIGYVVAWTPIAVVIGFILYTLSPVILFAALSFVLVIDILGWLFWFIFLGQKISEG